MHIDLTEENKSRYLKASTALDMSVAELCNRILASVSAADFNLLVTFAPKQNIEPNRDKTKRLLRRESNWKISGPDW